MAPQQRILLNIVATYGRSVIALACGLFTARWVLGALGPVAYGLWGMLIGMVGFVGVVNGVLGAALARYLAAEAREAGAWFRAGLLLLGGVGTAMLAAGYPIGLWMLGHVLNVPMEEQGACRAAWALCCAGCWVGMLGAPWHAYYRARQFITELTGWSLIGTLANVAFAGWMATHPKNGWLTGYAVAMTVISVVPNALVMARGTWCFRDCRAWGAREDFGTMLRRCRALVRYAALSSVQTIGWLLSNNGMAILVNRLCGPVLNGSLALSNAIKTQTYQLTSSMQGAFDPVIAAAWGRGDVEAVRNLAFRLSVFSVLTNAVFAVPLLVNLEDVLVLWLKTPPEGVWALALMALINLLVDAFGAGYRAALYASGKIGRFAVFGESLLWLTLPVAWLMWRAGCGVWSIGGSYLGVTAANMLARVVFARKVLGTSIRTWAFKLVLPCGAMLAVTGALGYAARGLADGFAGIVLSGLACELVLGPFALWAFLAKRRMKSAGGRERIVIALAANQEYGSALLVAIGSLARRASAGIDFVVLDGGLTSRQKVCVEHGTRPEDSIRFVPADTAPYAAFPALRGSHMAYARLMLPEVVKEDWVLYLDADIKCNDDIVALWNLRDESNLACVTPDSEETAMKDGGIFGKYFCSGMLLINLKAWREEQIAARCFQWLSNHQQARFHDQSALNAVLTGRVRMIDKAWNRYVGEAGDCKVLHYAGHNPWAWGWRKNRPKGYHLAWYLAYWRYRWLP